jgi:hypothetical protein
MSDPSLQILMPEYRRPRIQPDDSVDHEPSPAAAELEALSRSVIDAMNNRSFDKIKQLVGSKYKSNIDGLPKADSYNDNLIDYRQLTQKNPGYHVEVVNVSADVDEQAGYAIGKRLPCNL